MEGHNKLITRTLANLITAEWVTSAIKLSDTTHCFLRLVSHLAYFAGIFTRFESRFHSDGVDLQAVFCSIVNTQLFIATMQDCDSDNMHPQQNHSLRSKLPVHYMTAVS